jgi:hypothetical protein
VLPHVLPGRDPAAGRNEHRGCDAVALVCTEIPLLVTPEVSPLPTLDSTRLLARAAFDVAVGAQPHAHMARRASQS